MLVFLLAFGVDPMWTWLLFPFVLGLLIVLTTAVSMLVSSLYPRFRDMAIIWTVLSTVLFYASPVLYPIDKVPGTLRDVFLINPLAPLLELARKWVVDPTAPGPVERRRRLARRCCRRSRSSRRRACSPSGCSGARRRGSPRSCDGRAGVPSAVVAVSVIAWLAVMERDTRLLARGVEAVRAGQRGRPSWLPPSRTCARRGC